MKNYRDSDYALNKFSKGIVYIFADEIREISFEDLLRENPNATEAEFLRIKEISDSIYYVQDRTKNVQTRKNVSIHSLEETDLCATLSIEEEYLLSEDKRRAMMAADKLFRDVNVTEKQKQRFIWHCIYRMSFRQIAEIEGVHHTSVEESVNRVLKKLRRYYEQTE